VGVVSPPAPNLVTAATPTLPATPRADPPAAAPVFRGAPQGGLGVPLSGLGGGGGAVAGDAGDGADFFDEPVPTNGTPSQVMIWVLYMR